jgi:hopanoid biosynthesis associated RND transporter like protein HpnN
MKTLSADSILARLLNKLTTAIFRHPQWFVYPQAVLFVVCVLYTVGFLKTDMNQGNLVGPNQRYHQNYVRLKKEFPEQGNDLAVVVESSDPEKNRQFVERLARRMTAEPNLFRAVFYQHDPAMMGTKALFLVPEEGLMGIQGKLRAAMPFIHQFTRTTNLFLFFNQINTAFRTAPHETNAQTAALVQAVPVLTRILTQANACLQMSGKPPSPGVAALFSGAAVSDIYITFDHDRIFLLTAHPPNEALNGEAIERLRQLIRQTQEEVPGLNVGLTGEPVLDYDQMRQSQKDVTLASIVSLILCALIFIYGYNETGRPIKATICLVIGVAYTLAFTTLTIGHLNILTITFVPMLIGLSIDFGVHLITRYEEELRHGRTEQAALTKAMVFTGQGIFTGALTTAGAFLAMAFTHFRGIQEMGIICGGGLLLCFVPMMTLLPVLLLRGRQNVIDHRTTEDEARARIENFWLRRPVAVIVVTAGLCLLAWTQIMQGKVRFDYNLFKLQPHHLASVVYSQKLINSADKSVLYGAVVAGSLDEAIALEKKIQALPTVADIEPPVELLDDFREQVQRRKLALIRNIKQEVAPLKFSAPDSKPVNIYELSQALYSLYGYAGWARTEVQHNDPELAKQFVALQQAIENLRKSMLAGDSADMEKHATALAVFQQALFNDVRETFESLQAQDDTAPLQVDDLPSALRDRFVGVNGKFLLQIYPRDDVWQRENQKKFVADLRTVDPDATGTPVQLYEYETLLKNSYVQAAWYSLGAIVLLVLFHFRSLVAVILSLLPVAIGSLWLTGLMGWFGVSFNLANIMTLPLLIGIGVTNGIHVLNRFAEERTPNILARSTGKAVLVSGLTAIAGFGSLVLAQHYGMYSLGCVMATGITTCMIAGLTFLPALIHLLGRVRPLIETNQPSADSTSPTLGQEEPRSKTSSGGQT